VAPSILSADFSKLAEEVSSLEKAGADWVHVDVMDGHFVPNITIGAPVVKSLRPVTTLPLDVHLMIDNPEKFVKDFVAAGADYITIHVESTKSPKQVLIQIRELGCKPGITLKPDTPVEKILDLIQYVDLVLIMTVNPGFGGQSFMEDQLQKVTIVKKKITELKSEALIEVDGGINAETAKLCKDVDVLVAGSYVFKNSYDVAIKNLKGI